MGTKTTGVGLAFNNFSPSSPSRGTTADNSTSGNDGEPVNTYTGELYSVTPVDISLRGPMPLFFSRYYASGIQQAGITS